MKNLKVFLLLFCLILSLIVKANNAYVFYGAGKSRAEKLAAMAVAGIVNRDSATLYLQDVFETWNYGLTDEKWRLVFVADEGVDFTEITTVKALIDTFSYALNGAILYDETETYSNFPGQTIIWQGEFATMLAGLANGVPVPKSKQESWNYFANDSILLMGYNENNTLKIPADLTLESWSWNDNALEDRYLDMLNWGVEKVLPLCNPQSFFLREITDWAVSQKMFQVDIAGNEPNSLNFYSLSDEKAGLLETLFEHFRAENPDSLFNIYGWMEPEPLVQWLSANGATFHEAMQANLSWFHTFKVPEPLPKRASLVDANDLTLQKKYYVLFIGTEGDAGNWNVGFQGGAWLSPDRGEVPLAWGFNLHFFEQFPYLAYYYTKTATPNDGFVSVITPLGYTYSDVLPEQTFDWAVETSRQRVEKFKVPVAYAYKHYNGQGTSLFRGIEISNYYDTATMSDFYRKSNIETTFLFEPKLWTQKAYDNGVVLFNHFNDNTFYGNISNLNAKRAEIADRLKSKEPPFFYLAGYQRLVGETSMLNESTDIRLSELADLQGMLKNDPDIGKMIEFVTPEKFNLLLQGHLGKIEMEYDTTSVQVQKEQLGKGVSLKWNDYDKILTIEQPFQQTNNQLTVTNLLGRAMTLSPESFYQSGNRSILRYNLSGLRPSMYVVSKPMNGKLISKKILYTKK